MNRKQRRQMSKNLGILEYQQKLPWKKKMNIVSDNIIAGKQAQMEFNEKVQQMIDEQTEKKQSEVVESLAQFIAKQKNISLIAATEEARVEYKKQHRK
jgi:hypothetical protein